MSRSSEQADRPGVLIETHHVTQYVVSRFKIFCDPVHGFISVPKNILMDLIGTPEMQRLRRIRQLGIGHLVFPGAEHTRFGHALGAMALMQDALSNLADKGTPISPEESIAAQAAAMLHDIGHGPFSHVLEHTFIDGYRHENMSRELMVSLNERFEGALDLALEIFDGTYERPFFHQLVSSQLDMDRLDFLRRDSFYTGVVEGDVGVDRIIKTMRTHPQEGGPGSRIVIEAKGIYAIENYIISRRLMYWQVYLHKTVVAGDRLLRTAFGRMREHLARDSKSLDGCCSPSMLFFLTNNLTLDDIGREDVREHFCRIDDVDVMHCMKACMRHPDRILADLCRRFIERDFFRVTFLSDLPSQEQVEAWTDRIAAWLVSKGLSDADCASEDAQCYLIRDDTRHLAYEHVRDSVQVLDRSGTVRELSQTVEATTVASLGEVVVKPFVCYPKEVELEMEA